MSPMTSKIRDGILFVLTDITGRILRFARLGWEMAVEASLAFLLFTMCRIRSQSRKNGDKNMIVMNSASSSVRSREK